MAEKPAKTGKHRIVRGTARKPNKKAPPTAEKTTKQDQVLALLRRPNGVSVAEIVEATDWQRHGVRGFMSGALKKRLDIDVVSDKDAATGEWRYHVAAIKQ